MFVFMMEYVQYPRFRGNAQLSGGKSGWEIITRLQREESSSRWHALQLASVVIEILVLLVMLRSRKSANHDRFCSLNRENPVPVLRTIFIALSESGACVASRTLAPGPAYLRRFVAGTEVADAIRAPPP